MKKIILFLAIGLFSFSAFSQTKTEIKVTGLQKPISEYISRNLPGYAIEKAFKVDSKGIITYDVCVMKDKSHDKLTFDKDGKFLRTEPCPQTCTKQDTREAAQPVKAPAPKTDTKSVRK